jgi:hypothetical protein
MISNNLQLLNCDDSIRIYTSSFQENEHIISETISLHDPVGLQRIKLPCRAFDCDHLQCFDFNVFISMNKDSHSKHGIFRCSVCNKRINPEKVVIDYVALALSKVYPSSNSVKLFRNGSLQVTSGHMSSEFEKLVINSIYDLKKMGYMNTDRRIVQLVQLQHVSVFDVTNFMNTIDVNEIISIILKKSNYQKQYGKAAVWCETIEKSRPFYCSTWGGRYYLLLIQKLS